MVSISFPKDLPDLGIELKVSPLHCRQILAPSEPGSMVEGKKGVLVKIASSVFPLIPMWVDEVLL